MDFEHDVPDPGNISPEFDAWKIAFAYLIIAGLWIMVSDRLIIFLLNDTDSISFVQTYKGFLFVSLTSYLLFYTLRQRIKSYKYLVTKLYDNYNELESTYEELLATEEELEEKIAELNQGKEKIYQQAYFNDLTGLPNKNMLYEKIEGMIDKDSSSKLNYIILDLNEFKKVNDFHGHEFGDKLLLKIKRKLIKTLPEKYSLFHFGGDEFGILSEQADSEEAEIKLVNKILDIFNEPIEVNNHYIYSSASLGIVSYPDQADTGAELIKNGEIAMYNAKEKGNNSYKFYQKDMEKKIKDYLQLEKELRQAIKNKEFELFYQPLFDIENDKVTTLEALIRWKKSDGSYVSPNNFIPFAEETGLITEIGQWVFQEACRQKQEWVEKGFNNFSISINISAKELDDANFYDNLVEEINNNNINCKEIELEITESDVMKNLNKNIKILEKLRNHGIKVSLDDFGTGYSSLNYLRKMPIDNIKIDRSFINNISTSQKEKKILTTIIELSKIIGLNVTIEGIEGEDQLQFIKDKKCDRVQGYLLARPAPAAEIENYLINN
ncbi:MAG: putative bifunctional diguanylate cyclase/phosphodiesterase [Bacillota bacterium]